MLMMYLSVLETPEEQSKFEELYNQYRKLMYLCAKEILKDDALAEDAVQDAFLKIIYNFHKIPYMFFKFLFYIVKPEVSLAQIVV